MNAGPNILITREIDARPPEDLEGLKIRVVGAASAAIVEALGATPVQMPASEMHSLRTGLIDGILADPSAVGNFNLDEVASSYTLNAPLGRVTFYVAMIAVRYDGLNDTRKAAVDSLARRPLSLSAGEGRSTKAVEVVESLKSQRRTQCLQANRRRTRRFRGRRNTGDRGICGRGGNEDILAAVQGR